MLRIIAYYYFLEVKYLMTISINFHKYIYTFYLGENQSNSANCFSVELF